MENKIYSNQNIGDIFHLFKYIIFIVKYARHLKYTHVLQKIKSLPKFVAIF